MRGRRSPIVVASALAQATTKAVVRASADLAEEAAGAAGRRLARSGGRALHTAGDLGRRVLDGELGIGPVRLRPDDVAWVREQVASGLRSLLLTPADTADRLRTADPTTMARTVLALVGGEEALVPLPSAEEQIRERFRSLLDPEAEPDDGRVTPALLTITAQLSPDEARLLRHLATTDRAVVVAVESTGRTSRRGPTVAEHLSVLVERSGGDHPASGPTYIANLVRLGLCSVDWAWSGDHPDLALVEDTPAYREAVAHVRASGRRPRRRDGTLRLTALGDELVHIGIGRVASSRTVPDGPPPVPARGAGTDRALGTTEDRPARS